MKTRRHHNNKGTHQIKRGKTNKQVEIIALRVGVPCRIGDTLRLRGSKFREIPNGDYIVTGEK